MKKQWFLAFVLLALAAIYITFFIDSNKSKNIQITYRQMVARARRPAPPVVIFNLDKAYLLSSIKVVSVEDAATNKYPHALWHLVAKKKVQPMLQLVYSHAIVGMAPEIPQTRPEPLVPGVKYRLLVEDEKKLQGQVDFEIHQ